VRFGGSNFIGSRSGFHRCDQSCISLMRSYRLWPCCKVTSDESSAGNPHAAFCGSRERATAPATRWRSAMVVPTATRIQSHWRSGLSSPLWILETQAARGIDLRLFFPLGSLPWKSGVDPMSSHRPAWQLAFSHLWQFSIAFRYGTNAALPQYCRTASWDQRDYFRVRVTRVESPKGDRAGHI